MSNEPEETNNQMIEKGQRLRDLRKYFDLNQKEFADRVGMRESSISAIETGKRTIGKRIAIDISRSFNTNPLWLLLGEGNMFLMDDNGEEKQHTDTSATANEPQISYATAQMQQLLLKSPELLNRDTILAKELIDVLAKSLSKKDEQIDRLITLLERKFR